MKLPRARIHLAAAALRPAADFLAVGVGFWAAYALRFGPLAPALEARFGIPAEVFAAEKYAIFVGESALAAVVLAAVLGHYAVSRPWTLPRAAAESLGLSAILVAGIIAYFFFSREFFFSRLVLAEAAILVAWAVFIARAGLIFLARWAENSFGKKEKVAILGDGRTARLLAKILENQGWAEVAGVIDDAPRPGHAGENLRFLGVPGDFEKICAGENLDGIIQIREDFATAEAGEALRAAIRAANLRHFVVPRSLERHGKNFWIEDFGGLPAIELRPSPLDGWGRISKRAADLAGSAIGLAVLSPVLAAVALGVKISSPGPVIYRDFRVGLRGEKFVCLKFRSMRAELCDGEIDGTAAGNSALETLIKKGKSGRSGPLHKIQADPRRTRFGEFIRKTSLDELPQLWNVFRGEMSLVGPRPHMTKEVAKYEARHRRLFAVKPGVTGAAQVAGRSDLDFDEEARIDLAYIENWSLWRDFEIILRTVWVVLFRRHAE